MYLLFRASSESVEFAKAFKQKLPETVTSDDLLKFSMRDEFMLMREKCPILFNVVCGGMGLDEGDLEVFFEYFSSS